MLKPFFFFEFFVIVCLHLIVGGLLKVCCETLRCGIFQVQFQETHFRCTVLRHTHTHTHNTDFKCSFNTRISSMDSTRAFQAWFQHTYSGCGFTAHISNPVSTHTKNTSKNLLNLPRKLIASLIFKIQNLKRSRPILQPSHNQITFLNTVHIDFFVGIG